VYLQNTRVFLVSQMNIKDMFLCPAICLASCFIRLSAEDGSAKNNSHIRIRKAFLRLSRTHHPAKGGSKEAFQALSAAYEHLNRQQVTNMVDVETKITEYYWYPDLERRRHLLMITYGWTPRGDTKNQVPWIRKDLTSMATVVTPVRKRPRSRLLLPKMSMTGNKIVQDNSSCSLQP
jgi:hypothetical protein